MGRRVSALLPVVRSDGAARPQRLPYMLTAHGPAAGGLRAMGRKSAAILATLALAAGVGACGGSDAASDAIPKSPPDLLPPSQKTLRPAATGTTSSTSTTSTTSTDTTSTPADTTATPD